MRSGRSLLLLLGLLPVATLAADPPMSQRLELLERRVNRITDLTLQLVRYPRGEWICLEAEGKATAAGIGMMETTLWDGDGRFGRVLSTTVESPVSLVVDL